MKIISITLLITVALICLSLGVDILLGLTLKDALIDAVSPLRVMESIELIIFLLYLLLVIIPPVYSFFKRKWRNRMN
ncbi:Uncharacterised protein [Lederbergia lenta]|uniref:Uncharacterized protein n=1 Tax=Lederbergia lenta TaxID=1467 RepID=A0A2X4VNL2_LEDLE|nr:Uncharacterised protein [Lederbergia lenta]